MIRPRRAAAAFAAATALGIAALAPAAQAAEHTQQYDVGAELVRQPKGKPWEVNLLLGATMSMDDNTTPPPVRNMKFEFTPGAKVHSDAFKTCTQALILASGPSACPAGSKIGTGTAVAHAIGLIINANLQIFNGPGTVNDRTLIVYAKAIEIPTVVLVLPGKLKKTSGKYGWTFDLPIPPILVPGDEASVVRFDAKIGGYGKLKGKKTPFIEAPTVCNRPGWPFANTFTYADGRSGRATALMDCTIRALPGKG